MIPSEWKWLSTFYLSTKSILGNVLVSIFFSSYSKYEDVFEPYSSSAANSVEGNQEKFNQVENVKIDLYEEVVQRRILDQQIAKLSDRNLDFSQNYQICHMIALDFGDKKSITASTQIISKNVHFVIKKSIKTNLLRIIGSHIRYLDKRSNNNR